MKIKNIIKRSGEISEFSQDKILLAIQKSFFSVTGDYQIESSNKIKENVLLELENISSNYQEEYIPKVEKIQDIVEYHLMKAGFFDVAKSYIIYRYNHQKIREERQKENAELAEDGILNIVQIDNSVQKFDITRIKTLLDNICKDIDVEINNQDLESYKDRILTQIKLEVYDNMSIKDLNKIVVMNIRTMIEIDTFFSKVAAKLVLNNLYKEVLGENIDINNIDKAVKDYFPKYVKQMVENNKFDKRMLDYDLEDLAKYMVNSRDNLFEYMGIEILISRYLLSNLETSNNIETPQMFWMRIAMGTALNEDKQNKQQTVKQFYDIMSEFYYTPGGRTLYQSGVTNPQLSNCFINEVNDDLTDIFRMYGDNAQLLKWSGGVGTSWTKVRATGSVVKSVEITSQGVLPYLKIANDINICIMRSGKRRAAAVVYLETWHADIEDFLEARKNTGDERRRLHDINTANWIPDLFIKRVRQDGDWSLFSPDEVFDLNDIYGKKFEERYNYYESLGQSGKLKIYKKIKAKDLWKKMLVMLFETGHPWITFKDPANIRNPQDHVGVIHSSNLCTEIMLNTSKNETAVCTLGSINVEKFVTEKGEIEEKTLEKVIYYAIRMLDNIIDINFYPTEDSRSGNLKSRPVGLGLRGYHDALYKQNINFDSQQAVLFSDIFMEKMSYYAIESSCKLAEEKGFYETFKGSKWDRGIFPLDSIELLEKERGVPVNVNRDFRLDWDKLKQKVREHGLRNSNTMAIAPTASTANLVGCIPTIEPIYKNIYVKSNKEGEFTVVNKYMIQDLKKLNLWNTRMLDKVKFNGGSIQNITEIPANIRNKYKEVFDIDQRWLLKAAAVRGKWIDQSQSINIFFRGSSGKELSDIYMEAWDLGLKSTYYLRTLGASTIEKSTVQVEGATTHNQRSNNQNNITEVKHVYNIHKADTSQDCEGCSA